MGLSCKFSLNPIHWVYTASNPHCTGTQQGWSPLDPLRSELSGPGRRGELPGVRPGIIWLIVKHGPKGGTTWIKLSPEIFDASGKRRCLRLWNTCSPMMPIYRIRFTSLPIKKWWFSMVILNNQRISKQKKLALPRPLLIWSPGANVQRFPARVVLRVPSPWPHSQLAAYSPRLPGVSNMPSVGHWCSNPVVGHPKVFVAYPTPMTLISEWSSYAYKSSLDSPTFAVENRMFLDHFPHFRKTVSLNMLMAQTWPMSKVSSSSK